ERDRRFSGSTPQDDDEDPAERTENEGGEGTDDEGAPADPAESEAHERGEFDVAHSHAARRDQGDRQVEREERGAGDDGAQKRCPLPVAAISANTTASPSSTIAFGRRRCEMSMSVSTTATNASARKAGRSSS